MLIIIDMTGDNKISEEIEEKTDKEHMVTEKEELRHVSELQLQILQVPNI